MGMLIAAAVATALLPVPLPAAAQVQPRLPDADPALWVVNDHDTTIYLFGTFHALDGKSAWFNDEVRTAFNQSDELVLETIVPKKAEPAPSPAVTPPAQPVLPSVAVTGSASFLSSTRVVMSAGRSRGLKVEQGADMVLRNAAEQAGKSVQGLEPFEEQLGMFARLPGPSPRVQAAVRNPQTVRNLSSVMALMQRSWNRGEQGVFAAMLHQMRRTSPNSYALMFTDRNQHWAEWIAARLQEPGRVFVAVGAGHLAGRDSVQAKLSALGVRSARIN